MKERPILFSAPMVRAVREDRKTQTRRVVKGDLSIIEGVATWLYGKKVVTGGLSEVLQTLAFGHCPYGQPGDRLWVRESHMLDPPIDGTWDNSGDSFESIADIPERYRSPDHVMYRASHPEPNKWRWRPSIHMPRWASRILLEVVSVRVERLHDISTADCIAEGCAGGHDSIPGYLYSAIPQEHFRWLWGSINGEGSWMANPWVWVVEFKKL